VPNRLASESSPYLKQHADNPVDWLPWGDEAFNLARELDRPVFLSVGYSSCHWCHVMAHESFEDPAIGDFLNRHFVCIKVDREERPDVDDAYMLAVQMMVGHGGWPMSVFLTADRLPFFAGTYWPKNDRDGHPGFATIITQLAQAWREKRSMIDQSASQIGEALRETAGKVVPEATLSLNQEFVDQAIASLLSEFDEKHGGFGTAPKFPPHSAIEMLLRYVTLESANVELQQAALSAALMTLRSIVLGGIHDHVGGGFHRYSTDEKWLLPHFEKMLYDNALMLGNLAQAVGICADLEPQLAETYSRAAQNLVEWLMREMTGEAGYFFSAQDADSEGEEGKFYVWTVDEVAQLLQHHAPVFMDAFQFDLAGNFNDEATGQKTGANIPHLLEDLGGQFLQELEILRLEREQRTRPGLDDKGIVAWNGLMIGALADGALWPLSQNAIISVLKVEKEVGYLPHLLNASSSQGPAFLDDYAHFTQGVIKLAICHSLMEEHGSLPEQAIPADALFGVAKRLCDEMVTKFYDEENGAFYATSLEHENLFGRTKPVFDQPIPSANSVAIRCILQMGDIDRAQKSMSALLGWMQRAPSATESLYTTAMMMIEPLDSEVEQVELETPVAVATSTPASAVTSAPKQVLITISAREIKADANGAGVAVIALEVPEGLHLNTPNPPARWLVPTKVGVEGLKANVKYPEGSGDQYVGLIEIPVEMQIPAGESGAEFELTVSFQACTDSECLAPQEKRFSGVLYRG